MSQRETDDALLSTDAAVDNANKPVLADRGQLVRRTLLCAEQHNRSLRVPVQRS